MITSHTTQRLGEMLAVTVTSDLAGDVWFHWWLDGLYQGASNTGEWTFFLPAGEQGRVGVVDTIDEAFDPAENNPEPYPARRTLWWIRSLDDDVDYYRVEQRVDAVDWTTIATVARNGEEWTYEHTTDRLTDLAAYEWRVVPVDVAGNDGDPVATEAEDVVRVPDAPVFSVAFDGETGRVEFSEG
jgi:hypothetical protein